jgi:voltage-gated potassium channel
MPGPGAGRDRDRAGQAQHVRTAPERDRIGVCPEFACSSMTWAATRLILFSRAIVTTDGDRPEEANLPVGLAPRSRPGRRATTRSRAPRHKPIRRAPAPNLAGLFDSPKRNLIGGLAFVVLIVILATLAYMSQGWSLRDAFYMVIVTLYTVGYEEVRPINSNFLYSVTIALIVLGCTGMIFLTGVVVQLFTLNQIDRITSRRKMQQKIEQIEGHVIVCGFGRVGMVLANALRRSSASFVVLDENETRIAEARAAGYLGLCGEAASEDALLAAGVTRAHALASCLANDALNIVVTLSARALNPDLLIVARGDKPSTENKLLLAGADRVVLPEYIGGERIAELFLHQEAARLMDSLEKSHGFQRALRNFGMDLQVNVVAARSPAARMTVGAVERQGKGAFFIVQINRSDGDVHLNPPENVILHEGDAVLTLGRPDRAALVARLFEPRQHGGARNL